MYLCQELCYTESVRAYFAMLALAVPHKAPLVLPILDMMRWANVTEGEFSENEDVATSFGQPLPWAYLCYVREPQTTTLL